MMMMMMVLVVLRSKGSPDHSLARRHQARIGAMAIAMAEVMAVVPVGSKVVSHLYLNLFVQFSSVLAKMLGDRPKIEQNLAMMTL